MNPLNKMYQKLRYVKIPHKELERRLDEAKYACYKKNTFLTQKAIHKIIYEAGWSEEEILEEWFKNNPDFGKHYE